MKKIVSTLLLALVLAACGADQQAAQGGSDAATSSMSAIASEPAGSGAPSSEGSPATSPEVSEVASPAASVAASPTSGPTPIPTPGPDEFVNPVIDQDFPDPDTLKAGDDYYMYATNGGGRNIQVATSPDLVAWETLLDALPLMPPWATAGFTWAPEVTTWNNGESYVMYFTARDTASDKQCIGVATSTAPEGPFESTAEQPFICQADQGGSIDASSFVDEDGSRYVLWKNDGNCCGLSVYLYLQRVSEDGLTLEGEPIELITNDQGWEGNLVEAPTLWKHDGKYYLFYSANNYAGVDYAVGYAMADAITGPYTKPDSGPLLSTDYQNGGAIGPGGQDVVLDDDGEPWFVYHSWDPTASYRRVQIDELTWDGSTPVIEGPDRVPQPRP